MKKLFYLFASFIFIANCTATYAQINKPPIDEYVCEAVLDGQKKINVSNYNIKTTEAIQLTTILIQTNFDMYRVKKIDCSYANDSNYIDYFLITYNKKALDNVDAINEVIEDISTAANDYEKDYDKVKFVYDYILDNYDYDFNLKNHSVYELISTGKGVCSAYAMLFNEVMKQLDIPADIAYNKNHAWNNVLIDNEWYNIDCSAPDMTNIEAFRYSTFLKSDKYFVYNGTKIINSKYSCTSNKYDNFN